MIFAWTPLSDRADCLQQVPGLLLAEGEGRVVDHQVDHCRRAVADRGCLDVAVPAHLAGDSCVASHET